MMEVVRDCAGAVEWAEKAPGRVHGHRGESAGREEGERALQVTEQD